MHQSLVGVCDLHKHPKVLNPSDCAVSEVYRGTWGAEVRCRGEGSDGHREVRGRVQGSKGGGGADGG